MNEPRYFERYPLKRWHFFFGYVPWVAYKTAMVAADELAIENARLAESNSRLNAILYMPDLPQRSDASGEDGETADLAGPLASVATDAPQCRCKWGASGAHHEGCPCWTAV